MPGHYEDRSRFDLALFDAVMELRPELIVCAGYMRIISPPALARIPVPMINIHPSLLPLYPGLNTHVRALAAGDAEHGASVHLVTPSGWRAGDRTGPCGRETDDDPPDWPPAYLNANTACCRPWRVRQRSATLHQGQPWLDGELLVAPLRRAARFWSKMVWLNENLPDEASPPDSVLHWRCCCLPASSVAATTPVMAHYECCAMAPRPGAPRWR